jgi:hypothetical protein
MAPKILEIALALNVGLFFCRLFFHLTFLLVVHFFLKWFCNYSMVYNHIFFCNVVIPLFLKYETRPFLKLFFLWYYKNQKSIVTHRTMHDLWYFDINFWPIIDAKKCQVGMFSMGPPLNSLFMQFFESGLHYYFIFWLKTWQCFRPFIFSSLLHYNLISFIKILHSSSIRPNSNFSTCISELELRK